MTKITIDDKIYEVPGNWNELSLEQYIALIRICDKQLSYVEIQLKFFLHCTYGSVKEHVGYGMFTIKTRKGKHRLFADELASILQIFDYLFVTDSEGLRELSPKIVINHFKRVKCGCVFVYGPNDAMDNITYNEFVWLQTWQSQLNGTLDAIDELINVIYKTSNGKQNVSNVRRMSKTVKTGILWFYLGTLQFLETKFPHVFSGSDSSGSVFDNQQRIIDSLAEGDVTKKNFVRESLLYDALYSMEMAAIRMEEMEKQLNKNNKIKHV